MQVFNSYIDLLYPTEDRRERLLDSYFFTCQCSECTTESKVRSPDRDERETGDRDHLLFSPG